MVRFKSAVLLLVILLMATAARAETVYIQDKAPRRGTVVRLTDTLEFDVDLEIKSDGTSIGSMQGRHVERTRRVEKVLTWTQELQRISVRYEEVFSSQVSVDPFGRVEEEETYGPLSGNSYVVEIMQDEVRFLRRDGSSPTNEEIAALREDYEPMSAPSGSFQELVLGKEFVVGESIEVEPEMVAELMGAEEGFSVDDFEMTLTETRKVGGKPCAVLVIDLVLSKREDGLRMIVRMTGEVVIRTRDGWLLSVTLEGPMAADGALDEGEASFTMSGGGSMKGSMTYRYNR